MDSIILCGNKENIFSTVGLVYKIVQGLTCVLGTVTVNCKFNMIVYKLLEDFSCQSRAENKKSFGYCALVYCNPVCTCFLFDCHNQIQRRLNIVYNHIITGNDCNVCVFINDFFNIHSFLQN